MRISSTLLSLALFSSCGGGGGGQNGQPNLPTLPANPAGVLLSGNRDAPAQDALRDMLPSPVTPAEVDTGFMLTRLEALIDANATVADVNDALEANGARIVSMSAGVPAVTLVVPRMARGSGGQPEITRLLATGTFAHVSASYEYGSGDFGPIVRAVTSTQPETLHLRASKLDTAQNAAAAMRADQVTVVVPDFYASSAPDPNFDSQRFVGNANVPVDDTRVGRGIETLGLLVDVHPDPSAIDLVSLQMSGLTWSDRIREVARALPPTECVLNTGLNYDESFAERSKTRRLIDAALWRALVRGSTDTFVHIQSAGDYGAVEDDRSDARWNSPFALAAESNLAGLTVDANALIRNFLDQSGNPPPIDNLRVVGSATYLVGEPSDFSARIADFYMLGENVRTTCVVDPVACPDGVASVSSTRAAAAIASGLVAYMMSLAPERTPHELIDVVDAARNPNALHLDGFRAILGLDTDLDPRIRRAILDVAGDADEPASPGDGRFDEHDVAALLFGLDTNIRLDLNGDGSAGGDWTTPFDLDMNGVVEGFDIDVVTSEGVLAVNEQAVSDLDVLCYYANSPLFDGDVTRRDELLARVCVEGAASTARIQLTRSRTYSHLAIELDGDFDPSDDPFRSSQFEREAPDDLDPTVEYENDLSVTSSNFEVTASGTATADISVVYERAALLDRYEAIRILGTTFAAVEVDNPENEFEFVASNSSILHEACFEVVGGEMLARLSVNTVWNGSVAVYFLDNTPGDAELILRHDVDAASTLPEPTQQYVDAVETTLRPGRSYRIFVELESRNRIDSGTTIPSLLQEGQIRVDLEFGESIPVDAATNR